MSRTVGDLVLSSMNDMATARRAVFFHGLLADGGGGQANDWRFVLGDGRSEEGLALGLAHEMGHTLGVAHWGEPTGIASLICKPNYRSIMTYSATTDVVDPPFYFSTGDQSPLNSQALDEQFIPGTLNLDLDYLENVHDLLTEPGLIDWNRDGVYEPGSGIVTGVTPWTGPDQADGCMPGFIHVNEPSFEVLKSTRRPALAELNGVLHAFFVEQDDTLTHATFTSNLVPCTANPDDDDPDGTPNECCPTNKNELNDCSGWNTADHDVRTSVLSSPAATFSLSDTGSAQITLVYLRVAGGNPVWHIRRVTSATNHGSEVALTSLPSPSSSADSTAADPTLVFVSPAGGSRRLLLFYLDASNQVRRAVISDSGSTFSVVSQSVVTVGGANLTSTFSPVAHVDDPFGSPLVTLSSTAGIGSNAIQFQAASATSSTYFLQALPPGRAPWTDGPVQVIRENEIDNHLEAFYPWKGSIRRMWAVSGFQFNQDKDIFDSYGTGRVGAATTLYQDKMQLASVCPNCTSNPTGTTLQHEPFISGVFPFVETDTDDHAVFAASMCQKLRMAIGDCSLCSEYDPGVIKACLTASIDYGKCR